MIRPAKTAQDGWSGTEFNVFRVLWDAGKKIEQDAGPDRRKTQIGTASIMAQSRMSETTTRATVKSLRSKGDIEITEPPSDSVTPATYIVYSYGSIIDRRSAAGLLYYERPGSGRTARLLTTLEAWERWAKGEPVKQRPEHSFSMSAPMPPAGEIAKPAAAATDPAERPARSSVTPIARSSATAMKPEDRTAIRAELGDLAEGNMTAEADLRKADLAANPGLPIQVTVLKVRGLAHQARAANQRKPGSIHSPVAWMLTRIGSMVVDVEAEATRAAAKLSADKAAAEAADSAERARAAMEKARAKVSPAAAEKGREAWKTILADLEKEVIRQSYETWLKPTKGAWIKAKTLTVRVPSQQFQHIGDKYGDQIEASIKRHKLKLEDVQFVAEGEA
jgi:hypothetical protein